MNSELLAHHLSLITFHCFLSPLSQRIKVVAFFLKQAFFHQPLNRIKDSRARLRIVFACLKERVQVELVFLPELKASQYSLFYFIHGGITSVLRLLFFHVGNHRSDVRRDCAPLRVEHWRRRRQT